ncbi:S-layer homology domain-containing protein [Ureibacillus sp. FSL K6-3587]|uniref:S-layer homology domain-containing protein n=1 Tax=Ureibacillus sp. FSL K6-3587 TaxID=2954681 RepID=UPI0031583BB3
MRNKKLYNIALAATMTTAAVVAIAPTQADAAKSFSDLTPANVHYDNVMNLVERGVITGYPDGTFKPNQSISRAHAAKIIAKALGLDTKNVKNPNFKDIPTNYAYYGEIAALANAGIINGYPDGTFKPNATLTRGQMAKIIARAFELTGNANNLPFKDIANSEYKEYIAALYANKVTTGTTPTTYSPVNPVTRGQLASFVVRAEEAKGTVVETVAEIKDGKLVTKNGTFEITGELAKVFNANNAAALKDAKVELIVEDLQTAKVASLGIVVAARTGKVVGIKALTLVAPNTSFNAGGYPIPNVSITAGGVQVENLVVDELTVADDLQVTLKSVEVKELKVSEGTKLTLDPNSKIEKLVLPDGKKPSDVIANYDQVKDNIKETVDESGKTVEETPAPAPGGGGGSLPNYSGDVANAINGFIQAKSTTFQTFGNVSLDGNKIKIDVTDGSQTLDNGLSVLNNNSNDLENYIKTNYQSILDKVNNVAVSVDFPNTTKPSLTSTYPNDNQLFSNILGHFDLFNDLLETKGITTLGELENYYKKNNVEIKVTINFKDAQPLTYYIVFE